MRDFERYVIRNIENVDLDDETFANKPGDNAEWWNEVVAAAGFDPGDEGLTICELSRDWDGHRRGSLVVIGPVAEGRPFAVEK